MPTEMEPARPYEVDFDSTNRPGLEQVQDLLQSLRISSKMRSPYYRHPYLDRFKLTIPKKNQYRYSGLIRRIRTSAKSWLFDAFIRKNARSLSTLIINPVRM